MKNNLTDELAVCGVNAVRALGEIHPEKINRLFLREDRLAAFSGLCKNLAARRRPYKLCEDAELEKICKSGHHQGIVAMIHAPVVEPVAEIDLESWSRGGKTALLLCGVGNDHNLGAIVRAAAFFGAAAVVLAGDLDLTTSAFRVAEGGMEHVDFRRVRDPAAFLRAARKFLVTVGTDPRARVRIRDLSGRFGAASAVMLVLGGEETGLPPDVKDACSVLARVPGTGAVESLNVAQAASLFLQELYER